MQTLPESGTVVEGARVGIMGTDPLRSIGLQSILEEGLKMQAMILGDTVRLRAFRPDIVIVDDEVGDDGTSAVNRSQAVLDMPGVAVVVLVRDGAGPAAQRALAAGARAILHETAEVPEIRACIRAVLRGKTWRPAEVRAVEHKAGSGTPPGRGGQSLRLTPKEREVMQWLTQGRSNREIATTMGIDEATVKAHLGRMLRKADASNRVELMLRAMEDRRREA